MAKLANVVQPDSDLLLYGDNADVNAAMSANLGWSDREWHEKLAALSAMLPPIAALEEHAAQSMRAALG